MSYKILQIICSTNRIEYLSRTLESQKKLDFSGCEVTKYFVDDYPLGRTDSFLINFVKEYGFDIQNLHKENIGITRTWQEIFDFIKERDFDYVWHQEDDAEILYPVKIVDLIKMLEDDPSLSQIQLKRQNWYPHETDPVGIKDDDQIVGNYRMERGNQYFWMMSSLYPAWIAKEPILEETGNYPSEGVIAHWMLVKFNKNVGIIKTLDGNIMVNHIGEYFRGIRVLKNEPGWERFQYFDPNVNYDSKTGEIWK